VNLLCESIQLIVLAKAGKARSVVNNLVIAPVAPLYLA
jgi:hypothetical protein